MNYVYIESDSDQDGQRLYTVGFYGPGDKWNAESDWSTRDGAAQRVHFLNGGAGGGGQPH